MPPITNALVHVTSYGVVLIATLVVMTNAVALDGNGRVTNYLSRAAPGDAGNIQNSPRLKIKTTSTKNPPPPREDPEKRDERPVRRRNINIAAL